MLQATIQNFSYQKIWREDLESFTFENINILPSKCLINFKNKALALSKWVSPKRTRSYPYARVYDTFDSGVSKVATIIPLIKDEGINGDMDYLQWDTLSLMSLLNVYVIIGFYDEAQPHLSRIDKITNQHFNNEYILGQLTQLVNYHQSALHWNLNQLSNKNLTTLANLTKNAYANISRFLNIKLHNPQNIDKFIQKISQSRESFMEFSRLKAKQAQNRESLTLQPKEHIGIGQKSKIVIENYLGGQYFFTIDDILFENGILYLCESKHSKNALLPSNEDIKDGLLRLMLYNNLSKIQSYDSFKIVLRLTSSILQDSIILPNENLDSFIKNNGFSSSQITTLEALNIESKQNHFEIWINNER
ncbi:hypothetical protein [Helicobacter sp. UBA3407]|nr:hypothetical protein [Helicobacter sp. UBA3407]